MALQMIKYNAVVLGTIIYVLFSITGSSTGILGIYLGVFTSGFMIGNLINGSMIRGLLHGTIIGIMGIFFIGIIYLNFESLVPLSTLKSVYFMKLFIYTVALTGLGGLMGSTSKKIFIKIKKN
jgi:hypothetical protein